MNITTWPRALRNRQTLRDNDSHCSRASSACLLATIVMCGCWSSAPAPAPSARAAASSVVFGHVASVDHIYESGVEAGRNAIIESLGGGVAVTDVELDGLPDLLFAGGGTFRGDSLVGKPTKHLRQVGQARFRNVSAPAGIDSPGHYSHGLAVADIDNDGFDDALITGYGGVRLWRNMGDGTWLDATDEAAIEDPSWSSSAAWGDVNNDGNLDLYIAHYVNWSFQNDPPCDGPSGKRDVCPPRSFDGLDDTLFISNGDGTFFDVSVTAGLEPGGKGLGVVMSDLDLDGDLDVYVANDTTNNFLYLNDGKGRFTEQGTISGTAVDDQANANGSMGIAVTDNDVNGLPDLFVANYEDELFALYRNQGGGNFLYASAEAGLRALPTVYVAFGCTAGDYDLDGDEDLAIANGHVVYHPRNAPLLQKPLLLVNDAGRLLNASTSAGPYFSEPHAGRGVAQGDLEGDGDLDLVFANTKEQAAILLNETRTASRSLRIRLVGTRSNRDGIGARASLATDQNTQWRFSAGGGSYLSSSDRALHFGIPAGEILRELTIFWPSGEISRLSARQLALSQEGRSQILTVVESESPRLATLTARVSDAE